MAAVEVIGVYAVPTDQPCHLVEVIVHDSDGPFDVGGFAQSDPERPREEWQVAYAEKLLDPSGERVEWDLWDGPGEDDLWHGDVRLVFFLHHLDEGRPISTPFGDVSLPAASARPTRLVEVVYESP